MENCAAYPRMDFTDMDTDLEEYAALFPLDFDDIKKYAASFPVEAIPRASSNLENSSSNGQSHHTGERTRDMLLKYSKYPIAPFSNMPVESMSSVGQSNHTGKRTEGTLLKFSVHMEKLDKAFNELAKRKDRCQVEIEQLRRSSIVKYPGYDDPDLAAAVDNVGPLIETSSSFVYPMYPAPWNEPQSAYGRHYRRWLVPSSLFEPEVVIEERPQQHVTGRHTRNSRWAALDDANTFPTTDEAAQSAPARDKLILKNSKGEWVKLFCDHCPEALINDKPIKNKQGFINHYRLKHHHKFNTHTDAADQCGVPVDMENFDFSLYEDAKKPDSKVMPKNVVPRPPQVPFSARVAQTLPTVDASTVVTSRQPAERMASVEPLVHPFCLPDGDERARNHPGRSDRDPNTTKQLITPPENSPTEVKSYAALPYLSSAVASHGAQKGLEEAYKACTTRPIFIESESDDDEQPGNAAAKSVKKSKKSKKARFAKKDDKQVKRNVKTQSNPVSRQIHGGKKPMGLHLATQQQQSVGFEQSVGSPNGYGASVNDDFGNFHVGPSFHANASYPLQGPLELDVPAMPDMIPDHDDDIDAKAEPLSPTFFNNGIHSIDAEVQIHDDVQESTAPPPKRPRGRPRKDQAPALLQ